jgi:hypothetical protein
VYVCVSVWMTRKTHMSVAHGQKTVLDVVGSLCG